jgi:uncharacterized protein (TIGR00369 family)
MDDQAAPQIEYGVTPPEVVASMPGIDFVRAIFDGRLPAPPIMQTIEPFDSTAELGVVVFHSIPGFRHYNPIGSVHGGYAATLLDSAMGLAVHTTLPPGTGYTTLEFKVSFIKGMTKDTGPVRSEGRTLNVGRRTATAEARIASPTPRAACWRMPPRPAWCSKSPREHEPSYSQDGLIEASPPSSREKSGAKSAFAHPTKLPGLLCSQCTFLLGSRTLSAWTRFAGPSNASHPCRFRYRNPVLPDAFGSWTTGSIITIPRIRFMRASCIATCILS